jgi:hypothetical protein
LDDQVQEEEMGVHVARMARKMNASAYRVLVGRRKENTPHEYLDVNGRVTVN